MLFLYWENNDECRKCCIQHLASGNAYSWDGNCWFRLLSFPCDAAFFSSPILLSHLSLCVCLETDWLLGKDLKERSMGRKARRSPQWNSEMQMVPLTPRESGDFVIVAACLNIMEMLFYLLFCAEHRGFRQRFHFEPVIPVLPLRFELFYFYLSFNPMSGSKYAPRF